MDTGIRFFWLLAGLTSVAIGAVGLLLRRNALVMFMSVELMLNAVNLAAVTMARMFMDTGGSVLVLIVIGIAAVEAGVGLALLIVIVLAVTLAAGWLMLRYTLSQTEDLDRDHDRQDRGRQAVRHEILEVSHDAVVPDAGELDAYETLLLDVIDGDSSLFLRYDEVSWAWKVVDPILKSWAVERDFIQTYPSGSWGPKEAERLFVRQGHRWRNTLEDEAE